MNRQRSPYHSTFDSALGVLAFLAAIGIILALVR